MNAPTVWEIGIYFAMLSLAAVGGANAVIPDMYHQFVELHGWMSGAEFVQLVALAQAAPGPNVLIVSLLGWQLAGLAGALVATAGICLPSSLLAYGFAHFWGRFVRTRWQVIVRHGLAPITVGLVLASGYVLTDTADHGWPAYAVTAATVALVLATRLHPLWLLATAGLLGFAGLV